MKIVLAGLPGRMAGEIANGVSAELLHPAALASEQHRGESFNTRDGLDIRLVGVEELATSLSASKGCVALDFSPQALEHLVLWSRVNVPVVIGATAFDQSDALRRIKESGCVAVLAPNLAAPIVALQAILKQAAESYPGIFKGFSWSCFESHQVTKRDVSGTARALSPSFHALGFSGVSIEHITSVRDADLQRKHGVPEEFLMGHGWHRYEGSRDGVTLALEHRTNGRAMYVAGAVQACRFALDKAGKPGDVCCFDMVDVVRSNA